MKIAARIAVARDSAVLAPRAPNTVPEAPAPKPAPASAPLPRWSSTSATMAAAQKKWMIISNVCNIWVPLSAARRGHDAQEFLCFQRGATDQTAIDVGLQKQLAGITRLDAAAVKDPQVGGDFSIPLRQPLTDERVHILRLLRRRRAPRRHTVSAAARATAPLRTCAPPARRLRRTGRAARNGPRSRTRSPRP